MVDTQNITTALWVEEGVRDRFCSIEWLGK